MSAARLLTPAIRAATYETVIGLLSVTGMRAGEVLRLDRDDVDWDEGVLTVWDSKFGKSREIPLHPSALVALRAYAQRRDPLYPRPRMASFFVSPAGERLVYNTVQATFSRIIRNAGVGPRPPLRRARLHDMRHSFACIVLLGWYRDGADIEANLPRLSTYLGHGNPSPESTSREPTVIHSQVDDLGGLVRCPGWTAARVSRRARGWGAFLWSGPWSGGRGIGCRGRRRVRGRCVAAAASQGRGRARIVARSLGQQVRAGGQPHDQLPAVADQPGRGGDQPPPQGGDHRLAAANPVPFYQFAAQDEPGELVEPGGHRGGDH